MSVQQVAFPQHGILTNPGTEELLDQALAGGVEVIGGIDPAGMDGDPVRHLDVVFGLADRHGAGVDIHLHDGGSLGAWELGLIAERTKSLGLGGRVAVSHAYAFGGMSTGESGALAETLADAGRRHRDRRRLRLPGPAGEAAARAPGVTVACGHDGIRDLWGPYGSGDMLERARQVAYRSTFRRDDDIELALHAATYGGRAAARPPRRSAGRRVGRRPGRGRRTVRRRGRRDPPRAPPGPQGRKSGGPRLRPAGTLGRVENSALSTARSASALLASLSDAELRARPRLARRSAADRVDLSAG